jgi:hypothetical protein
MDAVYAPPVAGSDVIRPSEMIAIGDSVIGWGEPFEDGNGASLARLWQKSLSILRDWVHGALLQPKNRG